MSTTTPASVSFSPAAGDQAPPPGARQLCTFSIDHLYLGVDVLGVQEVIRQHDMTRVPLAPSAVSGLINLRGQIVTAIDLRNRLGLPPKVVNGPEDMPLNVVVRTDEGAVSLLVDEISDVIDVGEDSLEPPPPTLAPSARELIDGVYKLDGQLLLILNTSAALDVAAHAAA